MEKWLSKQTVFDGKIFKVVSGKVTTTSGLTQPRDVVEHNGGVAIVAIENGCVLLVKQFRIAAEREMLELPAGKLESPTDDPLERARAELQEETGFYPGKIEKIAQYYSSVGFTNEKMYLFLATVLTPWQRSDPTKRWPFSLLSTKFLWWIGRENSESKTLIGLLVGRALKNKSIYSIVLSRNPLPNTGKKA
jgi:ADP-ribose pyrophosphatase